MPEPVASTPARDVVQPVSLQRFFVTGLLWLVALTAAWTAVAPWAGQPVAGLAHMALEVGAPQWIGKVRATPGAMEVETPVGVVTRQGGVPMVADLVVEANPARYGYSLPIFLALVLGARSRGWAWRAVVGAVVLLPFQAFSLTFGILRDIAVQAAGGAAALGVAQWQVEAIVLGYQFGVLVVPTLSPIIVWLCLDHAFFARNLAGAFKPVRPGT